MNRNHRLGFSWLAVVLCMALLMTGLPLTPAYAKSKGKKDTYYTIKWKVNGETVKKDKVKKGEKPEKPEDPADYTDGKYTYVFSGWEPKVTKATKDMTYKAKFKKTERTFMITWLDDKGKLIDFTEVKYGKLPTHEDPKKKPSEKYTYSFDGWEPKLAKAKEDATYTATFKKEARKYTITWVDDEGNVIDQTKVAYGKVPTHEDPVKKSGKASYTFAGWKPEPEKVTGDATYTATFKKAEQFTITWLDDEGNVIDTTKVDPGKKPTHDDPTKEPTEQYTYTFTGWEPKVVKAKADATYTATFKQKTRKYTITWLDDEGNLIDETRVAYGKLPTHDDPTLEETENYTYVFKGWEPELAEVTGDATYTAVFEEVPKTPAETLVPEETVVPEETEAPLTYTITWLDDEGDVIDTTTVQAGEVPAHAAPERAATEKYSYTFEGWSPEPVAATADAAYTAVFAEALRSYAITWLDDAGQTIDTTQVPYGEMPAHDDPVKAATETATYTFAGWKPELAPVTGEAAYTATFTETITGEIDPETEDADMAEGNSVKVLFKYADDDSLIDFPQEYIEQTEPQQVYYKGTTPVKAATATTAYEWIGWTDDKTKPTEAKYNKSREEDKDVKKPPLLPAITVDSPAETTYYAVFKENSITTLTITWKNDDGSVIDTTQVVPGQKPTHDDPVKKGYSFEGWVPEGGDKPIATANLPEATANATYTAHFTSNMKKLADVYCYAFIKNKDDREEMEKTLLPEKATLDDKTEVKLDWSGAALKYTDAKNGVKNDGDYTYTTFLNNGVLAVTCTIKVGPKQSKKVGPATNEKNNTDYEYRYDSIVEADANAIITAWKGKDVDSNNKPLTLTVASIIDGMAVTAIEDGVFQGKKLSAIAVPAGVTAIGKSAFADCTNLTTLTLPDSLTSIGMNLIDGSEKLAYKKLSVGLETTMDKDASGCYTIKHVADDTDPANPVMSQTVTLPLGFPTDIAVAAPGELTLKADFVPGEGHEVNDASLVKAEIIWLDDTGAEIDRTEAAYGQKPQHANPEKKAEADGTTYSFTGWSPELASVTGPATYKAGFEELYTIIFVSEDEKTELWKKTDYKKDEKVTFGGTTLPTKDPDKEHYYEFAGWVDTKDTKKTVYANDKLPNATASVTYKAQFTAGNPVALEATYTGNALTKVYDCNKYGAYRPRKEDGTYGDPVYIIEALKTIKSKFKLDLANGSKWIDGHKNVDFRLSLTKQFLENGDTRTYADVGNYNFEFTLTLTGDDAAYYKLNNAVVKVPATITPRKVVVTPRAGLSKTYGTADPKYPDGSYLSNDESSPLHQELSGVAGYGVPVNNVDGKLSLSVTEAAYILKDAQLHGTKFFQGENPWLTREGSDFKENRGSDAKPDDAGKYKILIGGMSFGKNFTVKLKPDVFTITAKNLADANVVVKTIPNQQYTGKPITLDKEKLVVTYGTMTLEEGKDFTTEYKDNTEASTDTRKATVTLTGKGNYTGTREATFTIIKTASPTATPSSGGGSGGGSSGGGSSGSGFGGFDDDYLNEEPTEEEEDEDGIAWIPAADGNIRVKDMDYGTVLFGADGLPRPFSTYTEDYAPETPDEGEFGGFDEADDGEIDFDDVEGDDGDIDIGDAGEEGPRLQRVVIKADPMKTTNDEGQEEDVLLEGTDRKRYEELHLRLTDSIVQGMINNGVGEIVYELEQARLHIPLSALGSTIALPADDAEADGDGETPEDEGFDVEDEIEIEDEIGMDEAEAPGDIAASDADIPFDTGAVGKTLPVDGYDIVIEQADANGLSQREQELIGDNQTLMPAYRLRLHIIPEDAQQSPTGETDENGEPVTVPVTQTLPENYTLPGVVLMLTPNDRYDMAPDEAQVLYAAIELATAEESEALSEDAQAPMENAEAPAADEVTLTDDVDEADVGATMVANNPALASAIEKEQASLTPAMFFEEEDPMKVEVVPVEEGLYVTVVPPDWDPTPYLPEPEDMTEDVSEDESEDMTEDEEFSDVADEEEFEDIGEEASDEEIEFGDEEDEELVEF